MEGGTEDYGNVAHMHLVDIRLCVREMVQTRKGLFMNVVYVKSNGVSTVRSGCQVL